MYKEMFGKKLRQARIEAGYTQKEVEELAGVKQNQLSHYENNLREPDIETIGKLAEFYEVTTDWLFGIGNKKK